MIELFHVLNNSSFSHRSIQAFHNVSAGEKDNYVFWTSIHNKKLDVVLCTLRAISILVL